MANDNLWGEEDDFFSDAPESAKTGSDGRPMSKSDYIPPIRPQVMPAPKAVAIQASQSDEESVEELEEFQEEIIEEVEDSEEDFTILNDAHLRLEQGGLYKLIMKHDLFEGVDADPQAVKNVTKEIRKFAKERMEIMLGMRKETSLIEQLEIDFPFNAAEIEVLKALAFKATKGESVHSDRYVPTVTKTTQEVENIPKKSKSLNPVGKTSKRQAQATKPLVQKATTPVKRTKMDNIIEQVAREEGIPVELLEIDAAGVGGKSIHEMSPTELKKRNELTAKRRTGQVKSKDALPPVSSEQEAALAIQRVQQFSSTVSPVFTKILDQVKTMPPTKKLNDGVE